MPEKLSPRTPFATTKDVDTWFRKAPGAQMQLCFKPADDQLVVCIKGYDKHGRKVNWRASVDLPLDDKVEYEAGLIRMAETAQAIWSELSYDPE